VERSSDGRGTDVRLEHGAAGDAGRSPADPGSEQGPRGAGGEGKFDELKAAGGDALKDVSLEDIGDLGAEQITPTILQAKALEKAATRTAAETEMAKALGFDSAEELRAFRVEAETRNQAKLAAMGNTAAAAMAGQGMKDPIATPQEAAFAAFKEARTAGLPSDDAKAAAVSALLAGAAAQQAK